jgi:hypothetical protein
MKGLETYLHQILQMIPSDNALLREFLDVESHFLSFHLNSLRSSQQHPHEIISQIDFMNHVFENFTHHVIHFSPQWRLENCCGSVSRGNGNGKTSPASSAALNKRYLKSQLKRKNSKKKSAGSVSGNDFRMPSLMSSSHIELDDDDETESFRDSFRDSYVSESGDSVWRDVDGEGERDEEIEEQKLQDLSSKLSSSHCPGLLSPTAGAEAAGRDVLDLLSDPISIPSSTLESVTSLVSNLHLLSAFPSLSEIIVQEFSISEKSPPPSPSKPKRLSKRRSKKVTPTGGAQGASATTATEEDGEVQALRIRQTKNDSGRDNHPSNSFTGRK